MLEESSANTQTQTLLAAIDIGSNSFRLEIGRLDHGLIQRIEYIKEPVRQGADLDDEGNLSDASMQRGVRCLARFGERIKGFKPSQVRAVATQTLREARNSDRFLAMAKEALGFEVEIIPGVEEARLIYQGVSRFLPQSNEKRVVVDIGGRSTEWIIGKGFEAKQTASLHVGSVAWSVKHFADQAFTEKAFRRAEIAAQSVFDTLGEQYNKSNWEMAYGASGTVGALADILTHYGAPDDTITREGLLWLKSELIKAKTPDKLRINGLKEDRKPVIGGGLSIMIAVFDFLGIDTLKAAKGALRHGLQYDMLDRDIHRLDLRNTSVVHLMKKFHVDHQHANNVANVAEKLFIQLHSDKEQSDSSVFEQQQSQLKWACLLHEIGAAVSPVNAHKHGQYIIDHTEPPGFAQGELHALSLLILCHRFKLKKRPIDVDNKAFMSQLMCLRLSVIFCHARRLPVIDNAVLSRNGKQGFTLHLPEGWAETYPQSYYLLEEEKLVWQKVGWKLSLKSLTIN